MLFLKSKQITQKGFAVMSLIIYLMLIASIATSVLLIFKNNFNSQFKSQIKKHSLLNINSIAKVNHPFRVLPDNISAFTNFYSEDYIYIYYKDLNNSYPYAPNPICSTQTTNITFRSCFNDDCSLKKDTDNIAVAIVEQGRDETINTNIIESIGSTIIETYDDIRGSDDIVTYLTLSELKDIVDCYDTPLSHLDIQPKDIPVMKIPDSSDSFSTFHISGGIPPYKVCISVFYDISDFSNTLLPNNYFTNLNTLTPLEIDFIQQGQQDTCSGVNTNAYNTLVNNSFTLVSNAHNTNTLTLPYTNIEMIIYYADSHDTVFQESINYGFRMFK